MQVLEMKILQRFPIASSFYVKYVDDIALAYDASHIDTLVNTFNSFHSRLKFTTEIGAERLDFLDVSLIKKGNSLVQNWYHKPTLSGRYLNYFSRHALCQKVGTIIDLIDKVLFLSHPIYHQENFELIIKILLNNGYPLKLIFSEIKNKLSKKFKE